ncbi:MAG: hypothetical protein OCD03_02930 [Hyphomicrobiales bacterium]
MHPDKEHHELTTLFDFDTRKYQVWAMCLECPYTHKLDISVLREDKKIAKFSDLAGKFVCKNCDGKFVKLRVWKLNSYLISSRFYAEQEAEKRLKRNAGSGWKMNRGE